MKLQQLKNKMILDLISKKFCFASKLLICLLIDINCKKKNIVSSNVLNTKKETILISYKKGKVVLHTNESFYSESDQKNKYLK